MDLRNSSGVVDQPYIQAVAWDPQGSSYMLLPLNEPQGRGLALLFHAYPEGKDVAGTVRLKTYDRIKQELDSGEQGMEFNSEDPWLVMHGKAPNGEQLQNLLSNTVKFFNDGIYVDRLSLDSNGLSTGVLYIPNKRCGHFTEAVNKWRTNGIEIEKMHLDRNGMLLNYQNS